MKRQSTGTVLMVRPASFGFNPETAGSNVFQRAELNPLTDEILREFDAAVGCLRSNGIEVIVWDDSPAPLTPDAIFPNNWLGVHPGKKLAIYPMFAENRRAERDPAIIELLTVKLPGYEFFDFSDFENENKMVEGTGSLVFDHLQKKAFACRSVRTNEDLVNTIAGQLGYEAVIFDAADEDGIPYYHTNVVVAIGTSFAIVCEESVAESQRASLIRNLRYQGREIIRIERRQLNSFAGNMLELRNDKGELLIILSETAFKSLNTAQIKKLGTAGRTVIVTIPLIEQTGGGSIRCMIAEIF